jgi:peptidoglycan L-alanyl-D-glutamate endopeptidase CwlK
MTLRERDITRLETVYPELRDKVLKILVAMDGLGFPMCVTDGRRTQAEQVALYAKGRTAPGGIVTHADGVTKRSNHQPHDGEMLGRAVDCCFLVDGLNRDGKLETPSWDDSHPWLVYGQAAEALGLTWGGRWKLHDLPHVELRVAA